jgi:hypothetical protein
MWPPETERLRITRRGHCLATRPLSLFRTSEQFNSGCPLLAALRFEHPAAPVEGSPARVHGGGQGSILIIVSVAQIRAAAKFIVRALCSFEAYCSFRYQGMLITVTR